MERKAAADELQRILKELQLMGRKAAAEELQRILIELQCAESEARRGNIEVANRLDDKIIIKLHRLIITMNEK